jgi:hypothetical protein
MYLYIQHINVKKSSSHSVKARGSPLKTVTNAKKPQQTRKNHDKREKLRQAHETTTNFGKRANCSKRMKHHYDQFYENKKHPASKQRDSHTKDIYSEKEQITIQSVENYLHRS